MRLLRTGKEKERKLEVNDVLPKINRTQTPNGTKNAVFVPDELHF